MRIPALVTLAALLLLALGCATPETVQRRSSLTAYLGGKDATPVIPTGPATLQLPLRLGVAFVPNESSKRAGNNLAWGGAQAGPGGLVPADQEARLNQRVEDVFKSTPWAHSFKIIPSQYLTLSGGFEDLDQVSKTFGVDVIALISVDILQFSSPAWYSWTYWTLVGAYVVQGDKNDTTALMDAAVYHVPSRTFLFRAGGLGQVKGSSSWSGREDAFRQQAQRSLELAVKDLSSNLDGGVAGFKQDIIKGARKDVVLVDKDGNPVGSAGYDPTRK